MRGKLAIVVVGIALTLAPSASAATFNVNRLTDSNGACTAGDCSLREAVIAANGNAAVDEIVLGPGTHNLTLGGPGEQAAATGDLDVLGEDLTIRGAGAGATTIDANELDRVFDLPNNTFADLTLKRLRVLDGNPGPGEGGGVRTDTNSDVLVEDVVFHSNVATRGGAIFGGSAADFDFPRVVVRRTTFTQNSAQEGGAIQNEDSARLSVADSFFSANQSTLDGGAISNRNNGSATVLDSTFSGNSTVGGSGDGGGISTQNESSFTLVRGVVSGNTAGNGGGGVFIQNNSLATIIDSTVSGNRSLSPGPGGGGGGMAISNDSHTRIMGTTISGNRSEEHGGGIRQRFNSELVIANSTLSGNSARLLGGGLNAEDDAELALEAVTIASNSAGTNGGGIFNGKDPGDLGRITLTRTLIAANAANNCAGLALVSLGNNLSSVAGQCSLGAAGDLGGANAALAPLASNGGLTRTHALGAASAARDTGGSCGGFDQRGVTRPLGAACDIGAFEATPNPAAAAVAPDRIRPSLTRLGLSPKRFKASRRIRLSLRLSEAARVTFTVERANSGRRRGGRCVKRTRSNRKARRCTRYVKLPGSFARSGKAGANSFRLVLRLRGRRLKAASYRLVASARDGAGNRAVTRRAKFRIVR